MGSFNVLAITCDKMNGACQPGKLTQALVSLPDFPDTSLVKKSECRLLPLGGGWRINSQFIPTHATPAGESDCYHLLLPHGSWKISLISCQRCVKIHTKYCQAEKLSQALMSRVFIGAQSCRPGWLPTLLTSFSSPSEGGADVM